MALTRLISTRSIDWDGPDFRNFVFKHTTGKKAGGSPVGPDGKHGISVVDIECACAEDGANCICGHVAEYYGDPFPEPFVFWTFDPAILEPREEDDPKWAVDVVAAQSSTGDDCHRNVHGPNDKRAYNIFRRHAGEAQLGICADGVVEPFSWGRIRELAELAGLLPVGE